MKRTGGDKKDYKLAGVLSAGQESLGWMDTIQLVDGHLARQSRDATVQKVMRQSSSGK